MASIVTIISLANGVNQQINARLNTLSNDVMQITAGNERATRTGGGGFMLPGIGGGARPAGGGGFAVVNFRGESQTNPELTFSEAEDLKRLDGVQSVDARLQGRLKSSFKGMNASLQITGVDAQAFKDMNTVAVTEGRLLTVNDRFSAVLGYRVAENTFPGEELLNRQIKVGNYSFRVVGILNQSSGSFVTSDSAVYVPIEIAKQILNESAVADQFFVKVKPGKTADDVAPTVQAKLLDLHNLQAGNDDFTITTASFFQSTIADVTGTLSLFLGGIAAISLLVGAIGVANTMFMSVLERIKEIGVLKALGMKDSEVTAMFLVEAAAIGFGGGAIGVLLSLLLSEVLAWFSVPSLITIDLMAGALLFSAFVGIISGAIPARNAARLQPVEALRYE